MPFQKSQGKALSSVINVQHAHTDNKCKTNKDIQ